MVIALVVCSFVIWLALLKLILVASDIRDHTEQLTVAVNRLKERL